MIGYNIRILRAHLDMSQDEFADKAGISKFTVLNYERGKTSPTLDKVQQIESAFNVKLDSVRVVFDDNTMAA